MKKVKEMFSQLSGSASNSTLIKVHPDTNNPTLAWEKLSVKQTFKVKRPLDRSTPINPNKIRFVCISDTHVRTDALAPGFIPDGDVLLHAGDFTNVGRVQEIKHFNNFLASLPHRHKIVIAGNHEMTMDEKVLLDESEKFDWICGTGRKEAKEFLLSNGLNSLRELIKDCIFLEDSGADVCGIRIYGSPWQPEFGGWAFNLERGQACLDKWDLIPLGIDVLMTHGPPIGHGDRCRGGQRAGCVELLSTIQKRVKPKYHVFGHIHEGYGVTSDGFTDFINASICTVNYKPANAPIIFDLPLPVGRSKDEPVVLFSALEKCNDAEMEEANQNRQSENLKLLQNDENLSNML